MTDGTRQPLDRPAQRPTPGPSTNTRGTGGTRWERMERSTLMLERIADLHATAYRAENKSERTVQWHTAALRRLGAWLTQIDPGESPPTLASFTLERVRQYVAHLRGQTRWANVDWMPAAARAQPLADGTISWHVRGLRAI